MIVYDIRRELSKLEADISQWLNAILFSIPIQVLTLKCRIILLGTHKSQVKEDTGKEDHLKQYVIDLIQKMHSSLTGGTKITKSSPVIVNLKSFVVDSVERIPVIKDIQAVECYVCERKFALWWRKYNCEKCGSRICSDCKREQPLTCIACPSKIFSQQGRIPTREIHQLVETLFHPGIVNIHL